jgi:hypothetical protein
VALGQPCRSTTGFLHPAAFAWLAAALALTIAG